MAYNEDTLLKMGFVPKGARPRTVDPYGNPITESGSQNIARNLGNILNSVYGAIEMRQKQEQQKMEKLKKQADMYKVLRDSGYDPKSAYQAIQKNQIPGGVPTGQDKYAREEEKENADLEKTKAETVLAKSKADYWQSGGPGNIERMTANQLQSRLKFLTENPGENEEEEAQEVIAITKKLRSLSMKGSEKATVSKKKYGQPLVEGDADTLIQEYQTTQDPQRASEIEGILKKKGIVFE